MIGSNFTPYVPNIPDPYGRPDFQGITFTWDQPAPPPQARAVRPMGIGGNALDMSMGHGAPTVAEKQAFRAGLPSRPLRDAWAYGGLTAGLGQMARSIIGGPRDFRDLGPARAFGARGPNTYGGDIGRGPISGASRSVAGKVGGNQGGGAPKGPGGKAVGKDGRVAGGV